MDAAPLLEGVDLECARDERLLFSGLSFVLRPGQILQIEGANGSGKTSLLRILCGLTLATEGEVRWMGQDIHEVRADYYADLAYIGHAHGVKDDLTPVENLRIATALGNAKPDALSDEALEEALLAVGLFGFEDQLAQTLSAGQRRRVALARLLLTRARLWILDEPLTALDRAGHEKIETMLTEHAQGGGMVIFTSHHALNLHSDVVTTLHIGT
ncbi:MAG: hypothetical protein AMS22_00250 [Thiotrichales bacterium SG8_50]|nr:MAG: hypothetical protein AMS22_00250 [Thiotrichales bacterium SG8_50]